MLLEQRDKGFHIKGFTLCDNVFDQTIQQIRSVLHIDVHVSEELAETIKDLVEVSQDTISRDFGDIIKCLTSVVTDSALLIIKTFQDRREEKMKIALNVLHEADSTSSDSNQPALAMVRIS
jgi:predicted RNase H-related nuclease YkuK (DUF458 family)